jgi:hypothetical protein
LATTLDHRVGVGERAEQQRENGIDNQKTQDCEQQGDPGAGDCAPAPALDAALRSLDAPAQNLSVQRAVPSGGASFVILTALEGSLVDRPAARK